MTPTEVIEGGLHMMERYGGGFARALAAAHRLADEQHRETLRQAFSDLFALYERAWCEQAGGQR